ncbi:hypothetical protein [Rhodoferax sp. OV413]|uniref:hypothetical protein n=1 Tax=Rhodoferax sp. OV413 TaxID=1855285 RepID=UPI000B85E7F6|nr:hypothetical protein [Rhodoferax sp. OV413]
MTDLRLLISARNSGEVRCAVTSDYSDNLSQVLAKFGLVPDASLLIEHDRASALEILTQLLWKDMAYESECMPRPKAEEFAKALLAEHATADSKFFSNGNWTRRESWNPLTASTFDAGLIVTGGDHLYFCIWFQDED